MATIKGHFGGTAVVLDEPATLAVGQAVRVVVLEDDGSRAGGTSTLIVQTFNPHVDPTIELMTGQAMDERDALRIDVLDRVPHDLVRQPGSGRGEVRLADDFDDTPDGFGDYV